MKRRQFIQQSVAASVVITSGVYALSSFSSPQKKKHITILHTNDTHSRIEPFPEADAKYANRGGVSRRATLISEIRKENPNTLLLDAGDIFQGTPYFNFFGGELELKLMSMLKYDAATIGNHEFDNGIEGFHAQLPHANFDFVISNYNFSNTILNGLTKTYKVFVKEGIRIGVFGLGIELEGLVNKRMFRETVYLNPIEIAQDMTQKLRNDENCDLVICLSHLGYSYQHDKVSDVVVAKNTSGIDLIIGGHTHTFLPKPVVVKNNRDEDVLVNQVGFAGINLGRIDFYFEQSTSSSIKNGRSIVV
jgi:5'-nucleotidase